jgi:hypothetical protein
MSKAEAAAIENLIHTVGGSFSKSLGIDLRAGEPGEIFKWFLAAILFGAPISEKIAARTFQVFNREGITSPDQILKKGWDGLVQLLDEGGYTRYDFKTATKILQLTQALKEKYKKNLNQIHALASNPADLESQLKGLAKGIGPATVSIFLREMRGIWKKADPLPCDFCIVAAQNLGFIPKNMKSKEKILDSPKEFWKSSTGSDKGFSDFQAALVRWGIQQRRRRPAKDIYHL